MMVGSSFFILGIVALIPFVAGMLGFSRLTAYLMTAALMCGFIYLAAVTFSDALKFQSVLSALVDWGWNNCRSDSGIAIHVCSGPLVWYSVSRVTYLDESSIAMKVCPWHKPDYRSDASVDRGRPEVTGRWAADRTYSSFSPPE
jgi:hypothetical protein